MIHPLVVILPPLVLTLIGLMRPALAKASSLIVCLPTALYAGGLLANPAVETWVLVDSFGVILRTSREAAWFLLTHAVVAGAVSIYCGGASFSPFFHAMLTVLHAGINAAFLAADLFSLYVALELTTITASILIGYPMRPRSIWNAFRYLFVSNIAMLFYLTGAILVYEATLSFGIDGVYQSPRVASALLMIGLMVKAGVFIPGIWLPFAHSEAEAPVSALLSGVLVKIAVFPLLTMASLSPDMNHLVRCVGVAGALFGVAFALLETDAKRLLAFSTISQVGVILAAPAAGPFYACAHGLAKSCLFLGAGRLPYRDIPTLKTVGLRLDLRLFLTLSCLSIAGAPLLAGYAAKAWSFELLAPWQKAWMAAGAVGTSAILAKLIFLPRPDKPGKPALDRRSLVAMSLPLAGLVAFGWVPDLFTLAELQKAAVILLSGWALHLVILNRLRVRLPREPERLHHLIGMTTVVLLLLMVWREMF